MKILQPILLLCFVQLLSIHHIFGVSAYPYPIKFGQPDGDTVIVTMKGDEFVRYAKSQDGYTLLYDDEGFLTYARQKSNGFIEPSGYRARQQRSRSLSEQQFLDSISPGLFFSKVQLESMQTAKLSMQSKSSTDIPLRSFPTKGSRKLLCILAEFPDRKFNKSQGDINNLFNQIGYSANGATGSVRDYFKECSYDQLNLQVDVAGPFLANESMSYYGSNKGGQDANVQLLIEEMIDKADPSVDYSIYDNDNDGQIDGLYVIYAGYGEEAGGGADAIWAHAYSIQSRVFKDGKMIYQYSCSSELMGNSGSNISSIGVICHEFGHTLGAMDYYDTDYGVNENFEGTGVWDLQASGSWNNDGKTPAHPNPRSKIYTYNWATVNELDSPASVTIPPSYNNKNAFYLIKSDVDEEYFLIENRLKTGFDSYISGNGLMIYHGNLSSIVYSMEEFQNTINAKHPQLFYPVSSNATEQVPNSSPSSYGNINSSSCAWNGNSGKTSFTSTTTPALKKWDGTAIDKPITNIQHNTSTGVITFDFRGGFVATPPTVTTNTATNLSPNSATLNGSIVPSSESITQRGFEWKSDSSGIWSKVTIGGANNTFTYNLTGLAANTQYNVRAFATTPSATTTGSVVNLTTLDIISSTVTTNEVTDITENSVTFNGNIVKGNETVIESGFEWKSNRDPIWIKIPIKVTNGTMTYNITGLSKNTDYQVRTFVTTASGIVVGNVVKFSTSSTIIPLVITTGITNLTNNGATFNGNIQQNSEVIIQRGFEWRMSSSSVWIKIPITGTSSAITYNITELSTNTSYNVRTFAKTASGTTSGNVINFRTLATTPPTVTANAVKNVTSNTATLSGTITKGDENISSKGFEWTIGSGSTWTKIPMTTTNNILTYNLTGLTSNTLYNVRAFVTTITGTINSSAVSFTTLNSIKKPTVTTNTVTNIKETSATLNGTIVEGSETISSQGFEWKIIGSWTPITIKEKTLTHNLTGLKVNTMYYVRAFAKTASATTYGDTRTFKYTSTTFAVPVVQSITDNSAFLSGTINKGTEEVVEQGIEYKPKINTQWIAIKTASTGKTVSLKIDDLIPNTIYMFRVYAKTTTTTFYGTNQEFTTKKGTALGITENDNTNIVIYPNPTKNVLNVTINELLSPTSITINNVTGQTLYQQNIDPSSHISFSIDMTDFPQGYYYINIRNSQLNHSQSIVKY